MKLGRGPQEGNYLGSGSEAGVGSVACLGRVRGVGYQMSEAGEAAPANCQPGRL